VTDTQENSRGLPEPKETIEVFGASDELIVYKCGHEGSKIFSIDLYGDKSQSIEQVQDCPDCLIEILRSSTIRCPMCGLSIMVGSPVATYHIDNLVPRPDLIFEMEEFPEVLMGCLRQGCCPSGGAFGGHWTGANFRPAFPGGSVAVAEVYRTGKAVCVLMLVTLIILK